jgi:hypothetical protein
LVTILDEVKPDECFLGYNIKVKQVFKGTLTAESSNSVWVLPLQGCSDPDFDYGKDYLVAGTLDEGVLVVQGDGFVLDCADYTPLLPDLCP